MEHKQKEAKPRILAVDDDANIRALLQAALSGYFEVKTLASGEKILEVLAAFRPHLVIMDVMMPMIDGLRVTATIRRNQAYQKVPILFLTAQSDNETFLSSLQVGGDGYLVKPFSIPGLLKRVKELLREEGV